MGGGGSKPTGFTGTQAMSAEDLNTAMRGDISASYLKGPVQNSYTGMSDVTKEMVRRTADSAAQHTGILNNAYDTTRGMISSGGMTDGQRGNMELVNDLARTSGAGNPHVEDIIRQTKDNTYADVMASLGSNGMAGSSIHMKDLTGALADAESRIRYDDYNQGFNRQLGAAQAGFGMGQTGQANTFAAIDRAPAQYDNMLTPYRTQAQAFGLLDSDAQAKASFDPNYEHLLKYQGLLGSNASGPQPAKQPGFMDYAMLGGGLLSAFL